MRAGLSKGFSILQTHIYNAVIMNQKAVEVGFHNRTPSLYLTFLAS